MKTINISYENINVLNNLVGNNQNAEAVKLLRNLTGCKAFVIKYKEAFAGKYAPRGYSHSMTLWANSNKKEEEIFSYFLSNITYAEVFGW